MNKNKIVWWGLAFLIVCLSAGRIFYLRVNKSDYDDKNNKIYLGKCIFAIETVSDEEKRERGLSGRESLDPDSGMLFSFDKEGVYSFWMKDMRFPIDIIWLKDNTVVDINQNISYQSKNIYSSKEKVDKVLELNSNDASRCEIKAGSRLERLERTHSNSK